MIGNAIAWGDQGYTILEAGELDPASLSLKVSHYLICDPSGKTLEGSFMTLEAARDAIENLEAAK